MYIKNKLNNRGTNKQITKHCQEELRRAKTDGEIQDVPGLEDPILSKCLPKSFSN